MEDFRNAEYDVDRIEKSGKFLRKKEYTTTGHMDSIDAVEYSFTYFNKQL